jgi:hypothetical protein
MMKKVEQHDSFEDLLDGVLREQANVDPSVGFERRILAKIWETPRHFVVARSLILRPWWICFGVAAAIAIAALIAPKTKEITPLVRAVSNPTTAGETGGSILESSIQPYKAKPRVKLKSAKRLVNLRSAIQITPVEIAPLTIDPIEVASLTREKGNEKGEIR